MRYGLEDESSRISSKIAIQGSGSRQTSGFVAISDQRSAISDQKKLTAERYD
jgi:hypothetical protein